MPITQVVVRVGHEGVNLASDESRAMLDLITERLARHGATGQLWPGRSEFTLSLPTHTGIVHSTLRGIGEVEKAFMLAGFGKTFRILHAGGWERDEWLREKELEAE